LIFSIHSTAKVENEIITMDRNYFSVGSKAVPTKGELGFDYQLFEEGKLFLGYNHKTLWNIREPSSPVLDSNYNPSLFYSLGFIYEWEVNVGIFEHLSNGKNGQDSRGTNMSYLHFFRTFSLHNAKIDLAGKAFISYKKSDSNSDIVDYMGIWKGMIRLREFIPFLNFQHSFEIRLAPGGKWGTDFSNGHIELGLKLRPIKASRFDFYCQYFNGRNEYLLDYQQYQNVVRFGMSLEL
jgi:outer membrane phospholipase A